MGEEEPYVDCMTRTVVVVVVAAAEGVASATEFDRESESIGIVDRLEVVHAGCSDALTAAAVSSSQRDVVTSVDAERSDVGNETDEATVVDDDSASLTSVLLAVAEDDGEVSAAAVRGEE